MARGEALMWLRAGQVSSKDGHGKMREVGKVGMVGGTRESNDEKGRAELEQRCAAAEGGRKMVGGGQRVVDGVRWMVGGGR